MELWSRNYSLTKPYGALIELVCSCQNCNASNLRSAFFLFCQIQKVQRNPQNFNVYFCNFSYFWDKNLSELSQKFVFVSFCPLLFIDLAFYKYI